MSWTKREAVSNLVVLGDDEGQAKRAGGLLASVKQDAMYPSRSNYELVQKDGESIWLAGSASIGRQLFPADVGRFVKCAFEGWGTGANGKYKIINVQVFDGTPVPEMLAWPRYAEIQKAVAAVAPAKSAVAPAKSAAKATPEPEPEDTGDDDDGDLPF